MDVVIDVVILLAFLAAMIVVSFTLGTQSRPDLTQMLRDAARSGVIIKIKGLTVFDDDGNFEAELAFAIDEELEQRINAKAKKFCEEGKKVEAIKLVRDNLGLGLRESKNHVESLTQ
jgi:hypothetical protein